MPTIIEILGSHLLRVAEYEFIKAEPAIKAVLLTDINQLMVMIEKWIHEKTDR